MKQFQWLILSLLTVAANVDAMNGEKAVSQPIPVPASNIAISGAAAVAHAFAKQIGSAPASTNYNRSNLNNADFDYLEEHLYKAQSYAGSSVGEYYLHKARGAEHYSSKAKKK